MSTLQLDILKRYFDSSFSMLEDVIEKCPDELWNEKKGGFVFWQQILHTLAGVNFWMRESNEPFVEPYPERKLYPELNNEPETQLRKAELHEYKEKVKAIAEQFFEGKDDEWLYQGSLVYSRIKNIQICYMQMRHIQYHVGHCDSILRENGFAPADWKD